MEKGSRIGLAIVLGAVIIAGGIYFGLKEGLKNLNFNPQAVITPSPVKQSPTPTVGNQVNSPTLTPEPSLTPTPTPTPTSPITWTKEDILQALSKKSGIAKDKINFSISDKITKANRVLIRGGLREKGAVAGAMFLGVIDHNGVKITYVGNGVPLCQEVNPYGYPISWIDYCVNSSGQTVKR